MARTFALQRPDATDTASMTPMPAPFLATITAIALSGIAPLLIIYATPEQSNGMSFLGPLAIAAGAGLRFSLIVGARRRRLFEMVVWLFVYVFLGVAPVIQMRLGLDTNTTPNVNHALDGTSAGIVIAGCLAFAIGVATRGAKPVVAAGGRARVVSRPRANILTLACLALFAYYATRVGFTNLFTTRTNLDAIRALVWPDRTTGALVTGATSMGLLVSSVAQIYVRRQQKNAGAPMPVLLPLISVVTLFICVNPINSPRYVFGTVMLALIAAVGAYATVKRFRIVSLAALFGMVYLFPVADMFRRSLDPTAKSQDPLESMLSGDFDSFSQITNTAEYVAANDITWGKQLLGVVFFWVPRSAWPDKAIDTGSMLGDWKLYSFKNLSAPLWAELYINGGWVLLIVGMFIVGRVIARLDDSTERILATSGRPSVAACILPFYLLIVLRGSLLQSVAFMAVIILASAFVRSGGGRSEKPPAGFSEKHRRTPSRAYEQMLERPPARSG